MPTRNRGNNEASWAELQHSTQRSMNHGIMFLRVIGNRTSTVQQERLSRCGGGLVFRILWCTEVDPATKLPRLGNGLALAHSKTSKPSARATRSKDAMRWHLCRLNCLAWQGSRGAPHCYRRVPVSLPLLKMKETMDCIDLRLSGCPRRLSPRTRGARSAIVL